MKWTLELIILVESRRILLFRTNELFVDFIASLLYFERLI